MVKFKKYTKKLNTEEGATLVELLAAITILAIVVVSFLGFFVQAGNTNNRTDRVNEATFLAQEEMENVMKYNQITNVTLESYLELGDETETDKYDIDTKIEKKNINNDGPELYSVIVTVESLEGDTLAKMETWVPLKEADFEG